MAETIDAKRLPASVCFDTSTLIAASDGRVRKDQEQACAPLLDALVSAKRPVLVAAPSFAEFLRKGPRTPSPHLAGIDVVAFDRLASELLATKFPKHVLTQYRDQSSKGKPPLDYIKYDAMIVACALRHKAEVFVTLDDDQRRMAVNVGLKVAWPRDYMAPQQILIQ